MVYVEGFSQQFTIQWKCRGVDCTVNHTVLKMATWLAKRVGVHCVSILTNFNVQM